MTDEYDSGKHLQYLVDQVVQNLEKIQKKRVALLNFRVDGVHWQEAIDDMTELASEEDVISAYRKATLIIANFEKLIDFLKQSETNIAINVTNIQTLVSTKDASS